jgi:type V secretory pathway adhesin AidA
MSQASKDTRSAAEKARDTAGITGSLKQEGYVPTPEAEAVHQRVARGDITSEQAIRIFRDRALNQDMKKTDIAAIEAVRHGPARPAGR